MSTKEFIYAIPNLLHHHGITHAVISTGSRSAPLTLAMVRSEHMQCTFAYDERSAAYIALGMAVALEKPVVLVCTSGTAVANYLPAVCEAFWQQIPLLLMTADRPPEWIGQSDGQTIQQYKIFEPNIKKSYQFFADLAHPDSIWAAGRMLNEAIWKSCQYPKGPVHINFPFREPLYEASTAYENIKSIEILETNQVLTHQAWNTLLDLLLRCNKILCIAGQMPENEILKKTLDSFADKNHLPIIADINSNLSTLKHSISFSDLIFNTDNSRWQPDAIISIGNTVLSKNLKKYLRRFPPKYHFRIHTHQHFDDTFQNLTHWVSAEPVSFFQEFLNKTKLQNQKEYFDTLKSTETEIRDRQKVFFKTKMHTELDAVYQLFEYLPKGSVVHESNSLPVRYAQWIAPQNIKNYCNRGTSGIDGCTSTALGYALIKNTEFVTLITGDMSFFYDKNAFWTNRLPHNLRIILLNNKGGGIFGTLPEAASVPENSLYFITQQNIRAKNIAAEYKLEHSVCDNIETFIHKLPGFYQKSESPKILEFVNDTDVAIGRVKKYIAELTP